VSPEIYTRRHVKCVAATFMALGGGQPYLGYLPPPRRDESRSYAFISVRYFDPNGVSCSRTPVSWLENRLARVCIEEVHLVCVHVQRNVAPHMRLGTRVEPSDSRLATRVHINLQLATQVFDNLYSAI
jgi:hypothetical protein